jgi:hypothetical protein
MKQHLWIFVLLMAFAPWITFSQEYPAPEKRSITIRDFQLDKFNYVGKVIEVDFSYISSLQQVSEGEYKAYCGYWDGDSYSSSISIYFDEEAKEEFFRDLLANGSYWDSSAESVYLFVTEGKNKKPGKIRAIGTRYRKSKKQYTW